MPRMTTSQVEAVINSRQRRALDEAFVVLGKNPLLEHVSQYFQDLPFKPGHRRRLAEIYRERHMTPAGAPSMGHAPFVAPPAGRMGLAGYSCNYCPAPAQAIDHVWPRSRGGDDHPNNLVRACGPCNSVKGSRSLINDECPFCGNTREPGDVVTATGTAFYVCRCGQSWYRIWDFQTVRL